MTLLSTENLSKKYGGNEAAVTALDQVITTGERPRSTLLLWKEAFRFGVS